MGPLPVTAALVALFPATAADGASVEEALAARFPGVEARHIQPTPIAGLWEVAVGGQVIYLSEDGRYMLRGEVLDLMSGRNVTEDRQTELRLELVKGLDERRMVVFAADKPRHVVTVLTDIDCGYCRRLHRQIREYNQLGISVRYLFYPLAGQGSQSWAKAEAVWCSPDRNVAMTRAKLGEEVKPTPPCVNTPVTEHHRLAGELGVRGTPAFITERGELLPGYVAPEQLAAWLDGS